MAQYSKERLSSPIFNSRIHSANTQTSEKALGYFFGPCFVFMAYYAITGTYLTQFYTDVLGITGVFLTLMPVFSKIIGSLLSGRETSLSSAGGMNGDWKISIMGAYVTKDILPSA